MSESIDPPAAAPCRLSRSKLPVTVALMLLASCLIGATALSDVSTNFGDVTKILSVLLFIAAMIVLAIGMIGSSYRA